MADKEFAARINKLLKEHASYGQQLTPVQSATWPEPSNGAVVTNGDTTQMGEPRADMQQQANGGNDLDQECVGEIASLLLSIGYILATKGLVADKFNVETTLAFLQDNFLSDDQGQEGEVASVETDVVVAPIPQQAEIDVTAPQAIDPNQQIKEMMHKPKMQNIVSTYMEQRKLLESRSKKSI